MRLLLRSTDDVAVSISTSAKALSKTIAMATIVLMSVMVSSCSGFAAPVQVSSASSQQLSMKSASSDDTNNDTNNDNDITNAIDRRTILIGAGGVLSSSFLINSNTDTVDNVRAIAAEEPTTKKDFPTWTLENNVKMPILALNTAGLSADDAARACAIAAANGFRHFDFHPGKERDGVARFLKSPKVPPRSELFLTTKIRKPPYGTTPEEAAAAAASQIEEDLAVLGSGGYTDMLMIRDSPDCEVMRAQWKVVEQAVRDGKTRSLGVINFCEDSLRCVLKTATIKPALNYYYYHVGMNTGRGFKLRDFCDRFKIRTFAYGALGEPGPYTDERLLDNKILKSIGDGSKVYNQRNHGGERSTEEIALKWVIDTGAAVSVRPTSDFGLGKSFCAAGKPGEESVCEREIRKRAQIFDWNLMGDEVFKISNIASLKSEDNPTIFSSSGCPGERPIP